MSDTNERSVATAGWNEELVSVVTDYRIGWRQAAGRQHAIDLLMRTAGGGGGCGAGKHGRYSATAVSPPRLAQPTLTDAELGDLRVWLAECLRQYSTATEGSNVELAERWQGRAQRAAAMIERQGVLQ